MAGTGVRAARAVAEFERVIRRLGVPVTTAWTHDLIASDDPLFAGVPAPSAPAPATSRCKRRPAADARQPPQHPPGQLQLAGLRAARLQDPGRHRCGGTGQAHGETGPGRAGRPGRVSRHPGFRVGRLDTPTCACRVVGWCRQRVIDYPVVQAHHREFKGKINPYHFIEQLFAQLDGDDIVACGNATATIVPFQAGAIKPGMRLFSNSGSASMGYDLPAAIGAWFGALAARGEQKRIVCLAGDGSIMMNLQELQTIAHHRCRSRSSSSTIAATCRSAPRRPTSSAGWSAKVPTMASASLTSSPSPPPSASRRAVSPAPTLPPPSPKCWRPRGRSCAT
jgi:acetolactate synthase-1/2/3 large subunit